MMNVICMISGRNYIRLANTCQPYFRLNMRKLSAFQLPQRRSKGALRQLLRKVMTNQDSPGSRYTLFVWHERCIRPSLVLNLANCCRLIS